MVHVEVNMQGQQFTDDGVQYEYQEVSLLGVSPVSGPVKGGTLLLLSGMQLHASESTGLYCMFGWETLVEASFEHTGLVRCTSPDVSTSSSKGMVSMHLMSDDVVYTSTVAFFYEADVSVSSIYPVSGLVSGGTLVSVYGENFVDGINAYCKFGSISSLAGGCLAFRLNATAQQVQGQAAHWDVWRWR